jgi:hypothetical protein
VHSPFRGKWVLIVRCRCLLDASDRSSSRSVRRNDGVRRGRQHGGRARGPDRDGRRHRQPVRGTERSRLHPGPHTHALASERALTLPAGYARRTAANERPTHTRPPPLQHSPPAARPLTHHLRRARRNAAQTFRRRRRRRTPSWRSGTPSGTRSSPSSRRSSRRSSGRG